MYAEHYAACEVACRGYHIDSLQELLLLLRPRIIRMLVLVIVMMIVSKLLRLFTQIGALVRLVLSERHLYVFTLLDQWA